jgi:hypothetical protein
VTPRISDHGKCWLHDKKLGYILISYSHHCRRVGALLRKHNIHVRTGTVCNPAGVACALGMKAEWLRAAFEDGFRCDTGVDTLEGVPIGIVRVTLGAMSTMEDVETLIGCLERNFVERNKVLKPSSRYIPRYVTEKKDSLMESRESSADAEKFAIRVDTRTERKKHAIPRTKFEKTGPCPRLRLIWGGCLGLGGS